MVEIYFKKELTDITFETEALQEWESLVEELGMKNQEILIKGKKTPVPYPILNTVMERVYSTLCPAKHDYKAYRSTTIPLEVLKQIAFSVRDKHFQKIEIWADDKAPDPVVVGYMGKWYNNSKDIKGATMYFQSIEECKAQPENNNTAYFSEDGKYLVARWGDVLRPFPELKALAIQRFMDNEGGEMKREIEDKQSKLERLQSLTHSYFNGNITKREVTGTW